MFYKEDNISIAYKYAIQTNRENGCFFFFPKSYMIEMGGRLLYWIRSF